MTTESRLVLPEQPNLSPTSQPLSAFDRGVGAPDFIARVCCQAIQKSRNHEANEVARERVEQFCKLFIANLLQL